jgi:hypothetical protein
VSDAGWEDAIATMITDPALRHAVRQRALERLRAEYSLTRLGRQLLGVLERAGAAVPRAVAASMVGDRWPPLHRDGASAILCKFPENTGT